MVFVILQLNQFCCTGFGTMLNSIPSKSVAKSIIRTMEMNGTLETRAARLKSKETKERSDEEAQDEEEEEEEEGEEVETREVRKGNKLNKNCQQIL